MVEIKGDANANNVNSNKVASKNIEIANNIYYSQEYSTTENIDWTISNVQVLNLSVDVTVTFATNPPAPCSLQLRIVGGDTYSVTWPTNITWLTTGGTAPTLDGKDIIVFYYDGTNYYGSIINQS